MAIEGGWDVAVVGGANFDYLVRAPRLPSAGETVEGDAFQEASGGKGVNQAVAAVRLGAKRVALVARVGADGRGERIVARLWEQEVDASTVVMDREAPTGVALVHVDQAGEKQIATSGGANRRLTLTDVEAARDRIALARVLLTQLEVPLPAVLVAVRIAAAAGAMVVLDPAPAQPLPDELLSRVDVIRPNAKEAEVLTGVAVKGRASARRAAEALLERGPAAAIVSAPGGTLLLSSEGELWLPHLPVKVADATGAGDTFCAALAVALAEEQRLASGAAFANAAAALATTRLGAQAGLPFRDEVLGYLDRLRSEHIPAASEAP